MANTINITAPLPGTVNAVLTKKGDAINEFQPLLILEAMKMENELVAESNGVVKEVFVKDGQKVQSGEVLMQIEED